MSKFRTNKRYLLVEPINKSPYPPLGLMRISSMLKEKDIFCQVFENYGPGDPSLDYGKPDIIYVTTLFTWEISKVIKKINRLRYLYPDSEIQIGGVSASLLPKIFEQQTGIKPKVGIHNEAEKFPPDYTMTFGRIINSSITRTTRGCNNGCKFCCVPILEGKLKRRYLWTKDINNNYKYITLWDNNILGTSNLEAIIKKLKGFNKIVDFNQGLDARLYNNKTAQILNQINLDPLRFACDSNNQINNVVKAIRLARSYCTTEIRIYALYNYKESPSDFYDRINILNKEGALIYPMKYKSNTDITITPPNKHWDLKLLRAFGLSLRFYYKSGLIKGNRKAFLDIYGKTARQFISKLYEIYEYDKKISRKSK